jgi:hypothetical protein
MKNDLLECAEAILNFLINCEEEISELKDILKKWKGKKLADETRIPLFNTILTKCNLKSLQLEEEFGLPTHIPMPRVQPPQEDKSYVQ